MSLALETTLRTLLFPPEFELLRELLAPTIESWGTTMIVACVAFGIVGAVVVQRVVTALVQERRALTLDALPAFERRIDDRLLVLTSIPQIPAIIATMSVMFGGPFSPALTCMAVSSAAILTQALLIERALAGAEAMQAAAAPTTDSDAGR